MTMMMSVMTGIVDIAIVNLTKNVVSDGLKLQVMHKL